VTRAIADTSVFIGREAGRDLGVLPTSLRCRSSPPLSSSSACFEHATPTPARRLRTLAQVRATYPLLPIDAEVASCFARIAAAELEAGRRIRRHDAWIAATALRHGVAVATQDEDFSVFDAVSVIRV